MTRPNAPSSGPPSVVRIARRALAAVRAHARRERPSECCGLLIGNREGIVEAVSTRNDRASPHRYLVNPEDHFRAIRRARAAGLVVIGAYHSHPASPAVPSETDLEEAHERDYLYVIVSLKGSPPPVRAFRFSGDGFVPVRLRAV